MTGFDASELVAFAADAEGAGRKAGPFIRSAFEVTSRHIKDDWNKTLRGVADNKLRGVGYTVDYEVTVVPGLVSSISSEIGPNITRYKHLQASFAGWFEEGAAGVPATNAGAKALAKNEQDLVDGLAKAAVDAIGG